MQEMESNVVEVESASPRRVVQAIKGADNIISVTQLGVRQRVLVSKRQADAKDYVQHLLNAANLQAECQMTHPSLEDVFVSVTNKQHTADKS